jgi:NuA3 HAT complex component NTO1
MLAELVRKREREKLRKAHLMKEVLDAMLFPHEGTLRAVLDKISAWVPSPTG